MAALHRKICTRRMARYEASRGAFSRTTGGHRHLTVLRHADKDAERMTMLGTHGEKRLHESYLGTVAANEG